MLRTGQDRILRRRNRPSILLYRYSYCTSCSGDRGRSNPSGKAVDGIYDSDPKVNPNAVRYDEISIEEVVAKKLAAMDLTASIMCMEQKMPMLVFALDEKDSIVYAAHGKFTGTKVTV